MILRCRHCGAVVRWAPELMGAPPEARRAAARALCPDCGDDEIEEILRQRLLPQGTPTPTEPVPARCSACGQEGTLRPLTASEQRTYDACGGEGYPPEMCARVVLVRYGIGA